MSAQALNQRFMVIEILNNLNLPELLILFLVSVWFGATDGLGGNDGI